MFDKPNSALYDNDLIAKIADGDQYAFTALFEQYQSMVYGYALRITRSKEYAEEIVQNIFMTIWLKRAQLQEIENLGAYLNRATRNQCYSALRKISAERLVELDQSHLDLNDGSNAEDLVLYNESFQLLQHAVASLPQQRRQVYELCHGQGLKYEEVAQQLNISPGTVHSHMKLALKTIRTHLQALHTAIFLFLICRF